jgi:hypothetical protein
MFYTNPAYKAEVSAILNTIDLDPIRKVLLSTGGYAESVVPDEAHAYLLTERKYLEENKVDLGPYTEAIAKLRDIFRRYAPASLHSEIEK